MPATLCPASLALRAPASTLAALAAACLLLPAAAHAEADPGANDRQGKLLLTGGVSTVEGAAGGGLTPWAVIGGPATGRALGLAAHATTVNTRDYALTTVGATLGWGDIAELSLATQDFDTGPVGGALAGALADPAFNGLHLHQDILGLKLRLAGDAVLDSDTWMPQVAAGVEVKHTRAGPLAPVLKAFGAKTQGTDAYVSATKLFLAPGILVNGTLRATQANQMGLLGFGASGHQGYRLMPEASVAWLASRTLAVGAELRRKPDNFKDNAALGAGALREDGWKDVFVAWQPHRQVSLTLAWVDLGHIVPGVAARRQTGSYASIQVAL